MVRRWVRWTDLKKGKFLDHLAISGNVTAAAALILGGVAELVAWARFRRAFIPARDQLWTGLVGVASGAALAVGAVQGLNPHGQLGIVGGGAIIIGVLLLISGLGFHHEVRRDRGTAQGL